MAESGSNIEEKMMNEKMRIYLRKMIKSFSSYIKDAEDYEQLDENLKHMEETDENFHKHDMVELLTERIESLLGELVDRHVNDAFSNNQFDGNIDLQDKVAQKICNDIIRTKEFNEFKSGFKSNVLRANESLMKNFHLNFIENISEEMTIIQDNENKSISLTNDFDFSSLDNSLNQNSFVFYNSEQFPSIALNLDPANSDQVRMKAMQQLLAIQASDPQAAENWIEIRKFLLGAFKDQNEKISEMCLKLHSRTLASSHYKVSIEVYINLIEHAIEFFRDKELEKRTFKAQIDMLSAENKYILKIFRLINDYAKDITSKWTRYPEYFIESIINETLRLFDATAEQKFGVHMSPAHFMALLDIQANWFSKWMHGHDSRRILIASVKRHESFIQNSINSLNSFLAAISKRTDFGSHVNSARKKPTSASSTNGAKRTNFRRVEVEYAYFLHSLNVIRKVLCFKNGRRLFPIKSSSKDGSLIYSVNLKDLIKMVIQVIFETGGWKVSNEFAPALYAQNLLQDLCITEETCEACLCNDEVIDQLTKPMRTLLQSKRNSHLSSNSTTNLVSPTPLAYDETCMLMVARVLSRLSSTECGFRQLVFNNPKQNAAANSNKTSSANLILNFVCKALNEQIGYNFSPAEISEYLYLSRLLYSQCQGVFLVKEHQLIKALCENWNLMSKENRTGSGQQNSSSLNTPRSIHFSLSQEDNFYWSETLLDNLLVMASTPRGVFHLNETGLLDQVVAYLCKRYKSKLQVGKYEKFGYGFLISRLGNTASGCFYLNEAGLVQTLIGEIWKELESGSDDFMSAFPRSYSVEPIDCDAYKHMLCLLNILSSFAGVYELLAEESATPRSSYSVQDSPKGLIGLLDRTTFLDKKAKLNSLTNYEHAHVFGLRLLSYLQSDLDVMLLLESQYNYTNILLTLQKANRVNPANFEYQDEAGGLGCKDTDSNEEENEGDSRVENAEDPSEKLNIIIDLLSVERNFVLVNSNLIGGPREKLIPLRDLDCDRQDLQKTNSMNSYDFPLFDKLPVPSFYLKKSEFSVVSKDQPFENHMKMNFEQIFKNEDQRNKWLSESRTLFSKSLKSSKISFDALPNAIINFAQLLVKGEPQCNLIGTNDYKNFAEFMNKASQQIGKVELNKIQKLGVEKTIQYAFHINKIQKTGNKDEHSNNLNEVHKFVKVLLRTANKNMKNKIQQTKKPYLSETRLLLIP